MECRLPALCRRNQEQLDTIASFDNFRPRQAIPCGLYASDFAISCVLMQYDVDGKERVVYYQSRQLQAAERDYPVHDKECLAMKYALAKFCVYLLGDS